MNSEDNQSQNSGNKNNTNKVTQGKSSNNTAVSGELKVSFIDVGQADSILLQQENNFLLIDSGENGDDDIIGEYLTSQGVKEL